MARPPAPYIGYTNRRKRDRNQAHIARFYSHPSSWRAVSREPSPSSWRSRRPRLGWVACQPEIAGRRAIAIAFLQPHTSLPPYARGRQFRIQFWSIYVSLVRRKTTQARLLMARSSTSFKPGNQMALRHGAGGRNRTGSITAVNSPLVAELERRITETTPYLRPGDEVIVHRFAVCLVRLQHCDDFLERLGGSPIDSRGRERASFRLIIGLEREAREWARVLGLGPAVRSQMMQSLAGAGRDAAAVKAAQDRLQKKVAGNGGGDEGTT